ncbi:hypothetical protein [Bacillus marasmi]|uniref:hypothetical protein n=1 Tax=Bacillus marasmi TaxID=1926279 RepID=UPI0011C936F2|nr:hypothetical protein [Bacillus marasmi]
MSGKISLSKQQIELIVSLASHEAIKQYKAQQREHKKREKDWRLRNTKLLLENYRKLKDHCAGVEEQVEEYEDTILDLEELTLESLMKYQLKTLKMMNHFEKMLGHFRESCLNGSDEEFRRYKIINCRYLNEKRLTVPELCELYKVEQGTIYRDTKIAINDLSVLLFGISSLEFTR